jgi:hypothetical protein
MGMEGENKVSLWFAKDTRGTGNDYDANGANHIGLSVPTSAVVDEAVAYLNEHGVKALFETRATAHEFCGSTEVRPIIRSCSRAPIAFSLRSFTPVPKKSKQSILISSTSRGNSRLVFFLR